MNDIDWSNVTSGIGSAGFSDKGGPCPTPPSILAGFQPNFKSLVRNVGRDNYHLKFNIKILILNHQKRALFYFPFCFG